MKHMLFLTLTIAMLFAFMACSTDTHTATADIQDQYQEADNPDSEAKTANEEPEQSITTSQYEEIDNEDIHETTISFDTQVTEEFLSGFWSIFQRYTGWRNVDTRELFAYDLNQEIWQWVETTDLPMVFMGGTDSGHGDFVFTGNFYDRHGNILTGAPFIRVPGGRYTSSAIAVSFSLYDLNGDGIPEIVVDFTHWGGSSFGWS